MSLSQNRYLLIISNIFATIWLGFGINGLLRPRNALGIFEFPVATTSGDQATIDSLIYLYSVRDIFMGAAVYVAAAFGSRKALGWILISGAAVAVADGMIVRNQLGYGEWNHMGYAPMIAGVGACLVGAFERQ